MEFAQLQKKSKLRELVDIAERAHHFGSLKRAMSPEDYEIAMAEAAKQVKPFIRAIPFGARDLERIQHIQYEMPSRVDLAMSKRVQSSPEEIARSQRNEADRVRMKMHEDFRKFG